MNSKNMFDLLTSKIILAIIISFSISIAGCGGSNEDKKVQNFPHLAEVQNLTYQYFHAKSLLLNKKIDPKQFEDMINNINLKDIPSEVKANFLSLKPILLKFVHINYKSWFDVGIDTVTSFVRGYFGDLSVVADGAKQVYDAYKNNDYAKELYSKEDAFINSLGRAGITQAWFDDMLVKVGLRK